MATKTERVLFPSSENCSDRMIPETFFTVSEQLKLFIICILFGFPLGLFYDIFRIIRIMLPHGTLATAIEDVLFFSVYAVFITSFTYAAARSEFRLYFTAGNLIGFCIHYFTSGKILTRFTVKTNLKIKSILRKHHL